MKLSIKLRRLRIKIFSNTGTHETQAVTQFLENTKKYTLNHYRYLYFVILCQSSKLFKHQLLKVQESPKKTSTYVLHYNIILEFMVNIWRMQARKTILGYTRKEYYSNFFSLFFAKNAKIMFMVIASINKVKHKNLVSPYIFFLSNDNTFCERDLHFN